MLDLVREEIAVLSVLDHPNIVKYVESYEDKRYMYIVMEYVEDATDLLYLLKNLKDANLTNDKPLLSEDEVRRLMYMLLCGVHHIHENGIIHRDMKPENCLLDKDNQLRIIDFGLSKVGKYSSCLVFARAYLLLFHS